MEALKRILVLATAIAMSAVLFSSCGLDKKTDVGFHDQRGDCGI